MSPAEVMTPDIGSSRGRRAFWGYMAIQRFLAGHNVALLRFVIGYHHSCCGLIKDGSKLSCLIRSETQQYLFLFLKGLSHPGFIFETIHVTFCLPVHWNLVRMSHWQDFCIELHHCCLESQASPSFSFSQLISVRCQLLGTGLHISPTNLPSSLFAVRCCQMLIHYLSTHLGQFLATHPPQYFLLSSTEISLCQLICCQLIISVSCSQLVSPSYFLFIVS